MHLNIKEVDTKPAPAELLQELFRAVPCEGFPVHADWFSGRLRIPIGRRIVYNHHGWSHWFERERVIHLADGVVTRDREVDTGAMLRRRLERNPKFRASLLDNEHGDIEPLFFLDRSKEPDPNKLRPPDCDRQPIVHWLKGESDS